MNDITEHKQQKSAETDGKREKESDEWQRSSPDKKRETNIEIPKFSRQDILQICEQELADFHQVTDSVIETENLTQDELRQFSKEFFEDEDKRRKFIDEIDETNRVINTLKFCDQRRYKKIFDSIVRSQMDSRNGLIISVIKFFRLSVERQEKLSKPDFLNLYENSLPPLLIQHVTQTHPENAQDIISRVSALRQTFFIELTDENSILMDRDEYPHTIDYGVIRKEIAKINPDQDFVDIVCEYFKQEMDRAYKVFLGDSNERKRVFNEQKINNLATHISDIEGLTAENSPEITQMLSDQLAEGKKPIPGECEKDSDTIMLINFTNLAANDILRKYTAKQLHDPEIENIHVIKRGKNDIPKVKSKEDGRWYPETGSVEVYEEEAGDDVTMATTLFHELIHAKSFNSLSLKNDEGDKESRLTPSKSGVGRYERDQKMWLRGFNEAIVQKLTRRFYEKHVRKSKFFSEDKRRQFDEGEFQSVYFDAIMIFDRLTDAIYKKNKGKFSDAEEVEDVFIQSSLSGEMYKIERLIDDTFGHGTTSKLGDPTFFHSGMFKLFEE